jgi:hypothetical protein
MNVAIDQLQPGVYGISNGSGVAGEIIRHATGSEAGHAFLYLGNGKIVQGQPPRAVISPAESQPSALWAWKMWDQLQAVEGWTKEEVLTAQGLVVAYGKSQEDRLYDYGAYAGFALEVLHLRTGKDLAAEFKDDKARVCSALVYASLMAGKVPMHFIPSDGPGMFGDNASKVSMPPNLVAPGMLLGLGLRKDWF